MSTEKKVSNPGPLGLLGFGCTTILLNLHNVGLTELSVVILAMGVAVGGLAQLVAGIFEFAHGNTFTGTAFVSYSMFWWSLVIIWINPFSAAGIAGADGLSMGFYLLLWGLYTLAMFIGTLKHNRATQAIFGTLVILFFLLAIENFTGSHTVATIARVVCIICGLCAIYTSFGTIMNTEHGKTIFPLGEKH